MMTVDAIRSIEFTRGRGYRADEVDEFIDNCADAMEALARENQDLSQKLKVLADKLVEYRNEEDNIRSALISAQRASDGIIKEANEKAEQIIKEAQDKAATVRTEAQGRITEEKAELLRVQREVSIFKEKLLRAYKEHLALINVLPDLKTEETAPAEEKPVITPKEEPTATVVAPAEAEEAAPAEEEMKPLSRFADLKFGNDYHIADDVDDEDDIKIVDD